MNTIVRHVMCLLVLIFLVITITASGFSQQQQNNDVTEKIDNIVKDVEETGSKKDPTVGDDDVRIFLKKIEVMGYVEKPQAVFIIPGSDPRIDDIGLSRSFFKEIFRPVERSRLQKNISRRSQDYIPW